MEILELVLSICIIMSVTTAIFNIISAFTSKSYLKYREQLKQYEMKKEQIEEELENERKKF